MLSAFDDDENLFSAIKYGADGYLLKNLKMPQFFDLLDGLRSGVTPISRVLADRILQEFRKFDAVTRSSHAAHERLTENEIETLEMLVKGSSNKDIAVVLHISENTVKLHIRNIMQKLHLQNRTQLAVYALQENLVNKEPRTEHPVLPGPS